MLQLRHPARQGLQCRLQHRPCRGGASPSVAGILRLQAGEDVKGHDGGAAVERLGEVFASVCRDFGVEPRAFDGGEDHGHLLAVYPPKVTLSKLVNSLKGVTSRLLRKERPDLANCLRRGVLRSPSCFAASCGGAPLSVVREYVESQRTPA